MQLSVIKNLLHYRSVNLRAVGRPLAKILEQLLSRQGAERQKTMRKNRRNCYFTAILLLHILVCFFKIDRDVFAFQEYYNQPNQSYTEQPLLRGVSYFGSSISSFPELSKTCGVKKSAQESIAIWDSIFLSYNSRVHHLMKLTEPYFAPITSKFAFLYRRNIFHKSSEDDELEIRFVV